MLSKIIKKLIKKLIKNIIKMNEAGKNYQRVSGNRANHTLFISKYIKPDQKNAANSKLNLSMRSTKNINEEIYSPKQNESFKNEISYKKVNNTYVNKYIKEEKNIKKDNVANISNRYQLNSKYEINNNKDNVNIDINNDKNYKYSNRTFNRLNPQNTNKDNKTIDNISLNNDRVNIYIGNKNNNIINNSFNTINTRSKPKPLDNNNNFKNNIKNNSKENTKENTKVNQINASTENKSKENIKINNRDKPEEKDKDKTKNSNHINVIDAKNKNSKKDNNTNEKELEKIEFVPVNDPLYEKKIADNTIFIQLRNHYYSEYKDAYNKLLDNPDIKYSSIYFHFDNNTKFLKGLNIDFRKITKLTLDKGPEFNTDDNSVFETLFSLDNIQNNLVHLTIRFRWNEREYSNFLGYKLSPKVNDKLFENINNMKKLRYLNLISVNFEKKVTIRLNSLKVLLCSDCENLCMENIICPNLEKLYYYNKDITDVSQFNEIKNDNFKKLKELYLTGSLSPINVLKDAKGVK